MAKSYSPPKTTNKWIRYFLGLTVGVAVGMSPYLGVLNIPFFRPLLDLIPVTLQNILIPLSSASMGIIAAVVQWYTGSTFTRKRLNSLFVKCLTVCFLSFFALMIIHTIFVVSIPIKAGKETVSFLVGYSRPVEEPCPSSVSDGACIELLSFNPSEISSFWGDKQIRVARLLLFGSYLFFTCSFGSIIGLIVFRESYLKNSNRKERKPPEEN